MITLEFKRARRDLFCAYLGGKMVSYAHYDAKRNFIDTLWVREDLRRQGVATQLVHYLTAAIGRKVLRCPDHLKNDAVRGLSIKLGGLMGAEARVHPR